MNRIVEEEFWRLLLLVVVVLVCTALFGNFFTWFAIAVAIYLAWYLRQLVRLLEWLERRLTGDAPKSSGIWEDVFMRLYRFRLRNKRRHKRLVKRISRFQEAAQAMPNAIVVLKNDTTIEWCNSAATKMLGIHTSHDLGQRLLNLVRHPQLVNYIEKADFEMPLLMPSPVNETRTLSVRLVGYGDDQTLLVARDITRLQQLKQMRRDFVANVSHEMRTPLTVINGYVEMMRDDDSLSKQEASEILQRIDEQSIRLQSIVDDLLQLSRLESTSTDTTVSVVNTPFLIDSIIADAKELSNEQQHELIADIDRNLNICGSEIEIRSAFSNLIFNAVRYTPDKGQINVSWYKDSTGAHFTVRDTGIGIPAHHLARLTERFYRVDVARSRHTGGTGLGLAIVKHVLQRHDGELEINSTAGIGSTFTCHFPSSRIADEQA